MQCHGPISLRGRGHFQAPAELCKPDIRKPGFFGSMHHRLRRHTKCLSTGWSQISSATRESSSKYFQLQEENLGIRNGLGFLSDAPAQRHFVELFRLQSWLLLASRLWAVYSQRARIYPPVSSFATSEIVQPSRVRLAAFLTESGF